MKQNLGTYDRVMRFVLGVVLVTLGLVSRSGLLVLGGLFCLYEALFSWCALYQLLGKNSCPLVSHKRLEVPLLRQALIGYGILGSAIVINYAGSVIGWSSWYTFLQNPFVLLPIDHYVYLFVVYPLALGVIGYTIIQIVEKNEASSY